MLRAVNLDNALAAAGPVAFGEEMPASGAEPGYNNLGPDQLGRVKRLARRRLGEFVARLNAAACPLGIL